MRIKFVPPKEQTEKYKIEKKNSAYLLNTPPLINLHNNNIYCILARSESRL